MLEFDTTDNAIEPFLIRAHHLENLRQVVDGQSSAEGMAAQSRLDSRNDPAVYDRGHAYYTDVFGLDGTMADGTESRMAKFYKTFLALGSSHPVKIVTDQPDGICNSCIIGDHCRLKNGLLTSETSGDRKHLRTFASVADNVGLGRTIRKISETASYADGRPRRAPSLVTTAETVRTVLSKPESRPSKPGFVVRQTAALIDSATPETFHRNHPTIGGKLATLRRVAGAYALTMIAGGMFHIGYAAKTYDDLPANVDLNGAQAQQFRREGSKTASDFGQFAVGGLVYSLGRRTSRKEARRL